MINGFFPVGICVKKTWNAQLYNFSYPHLFLFRHQLWRFRNVFINLLPWIIAVTFPRHRKKHLLFGTLWLDPKIIYPKKHRSPQEAFACMSFLRLWITSAFFEITHGVSSGPSEPKTTTKISTNGRSWPPNQLGVIVVAMRSIRKAFPWEDGELANLRAGDLFVMVGRLRSVMNVWPF